ncbi:NAD(P)-binding protein [Altererythrobacter gangjinensis]|uniref:NAD(P)-binding protein n=2 Tax=Pontixanthobacter gangjinensis TaxID=1028742 RepID=A0A6I4SN76_9SPHN|nr:NAD(P)-binding protein [Pontixanthobacter gangjinensis]
MAGLSCATELAKYGVQPVIFDKGRGPGGRMATRRAELGTELGTKLGQNTLHFDHGAQYFTARDPSFTATVGKWLVRGAASSWPAAGDNSYVGVPGMNGPLKLMARDLGVRWGERVDRIERNDGLWALTLGEAVEHYAQCVIAVPAEQAANLLAGNAPVFAEQAVAVQSSPCWALMVSFDARLPIDSDVMRSTVGGIAWAARNSAKPGRGGPESWVIHGSAELSREILEQEASDASARLLREFFAQAEIEPIEPVHLAAHRWRFAKAGKSDGPPSLWDNAIKLGVAGDWLIEPRVEAAWLSGRALAEQILESFQR